MCNGGVDEHETDLKLILVLLTFDWRIDDRFGLVGTTPGRLQSSLQKLHDAGLLTVKGRLDPTVYPTVELLCQQDPLLSENDGQKIIRRLERA